MSAPKPVGTVGWVDLTVPDADRVRDFYQAVVGWSASGVGMGGYDDYCMIPPRGDAPAAGVCHARGPNAGLPAVWLVYIVVADLDASTAKVVELGGEVLRGPSSPAGSDRFCVIRDPAGAVCALFQSAA